MKFITEEDLRDLYKKQPFKNYDLQEGERLTPGARQFLVDRGVDMYDRNDPFVMADSSPTVTVTGGKPECKKNLLLDCKIKAMENKFLITTKELLDIDVCMSQQLTGLVREVAGLCQMAEGTCDLPELGCNPCGGMNRENFSECLGDCFESNEFHMQMAKGKGMLLLAGLRCELRILALEAEPLIGDAKVYEKFLGKLNQIINTLSQMICTAMGGSECQRKS